MKMKHDCPVIYLDENKWIDLGHAYYELPRGKKFKHACELVIAASTHDKAVFPLSAEHYMETRKRIDVESRKRLAKVIAQISKGWSLAPSEYMTTHEIRSAMARLFSAEQYDIPPFLGKGVNFAFGQADNPPKGVRVGNERWQEMQKLSATPGGLKLFLIGSSEARNADGRKIFWEQIDYLAKTYDNLKRAGDVYPIGLRKRAVATRWVIENRDVLVKTLAVYQRNFDDFLAFGKDRLMNFFEQVPTLDCEFELRSEHYKNTTRSFTANDVLDLSFLGVAIPYCDIVVTEKYWSSLAKRRKLDEKYQTIILSDLAKIESYLPS